MIEFSRCPKCATLYDLRTIDLAVSGGWVQCGECERKFKAATYEVDRREISFHEPERYISDSDRQSTVSTTISTTQSPHELSDDIVVKKRRKNKNKLKRYPVSENLARQKSDLQKLYNQESEFSDKTITMEVSVHEDGLDGELSEIMDDLLNPEMVVEGMAILEEAKPSSRKNAYADSMSEFSEELIDIKPTKPKKTFFEEVEEAQQGVKVVEKQKKAVFSKVLFVLLIGFFLLLASLFSFQIHSRGSYEWIPDEMYENLLANIPQLSRLERNQFDLAKLHLASTRMETLEGQDNGRRIVLQLINKSRFNQAYPDFQIEFTNAQGQVIARRLIWPSLYLEQGHLGVIESKEAKTISFDLVSLPENAAGYELKIVKQDG